MVIPGKIKDILNDQKNDGLINYVMYDNVRSFNQRLDRIDNTVEPVALFYVLTNWNYDISYGEVREGARIFIYFVSRAKFDGTAEDNALIVENMESIARDFISRVIDDGEFSVESARVDAATPEFDGHWDGVRLNLDIKQKRGECI